jgi:nicotinamidase-related amidase
VPQSIINSALLVVDIQNDFTTKNGKYPIDLSQADEIISNVNKLINHAQQLNLTVIYIGNEYSLFNPLNIFRNFAAIVGSEGAKLDPRLTLINQNYFPKSTGDAFSNPDLIKFLNQNDIDEAIVVGVYAEACILATVKGAIEQKLRVKVLADGIGAKSQGKREIYLEKYKKIGAEILDTKQIIEGQIQIFL